MGENELIDYKTVTEKQNKEKMNQDETTPTFEPKPNWKKYILVVLVVGILIFSCIVIGLVFLSQFI